MNRVSILCLLLFFGGCVSESSINEPRSVDFNFGWLFVLDDDPRFSDPDFDDSGWRQLRLPHDWSIEADFSEEYDGATAYLPGGIGWYRKALTTTAGDVNRITYLYFDGVYNHSTIWVNGREVGGQNNGYTPFYFDVSDFLNAAGEENTVAVRVDRSRYIDSRWYTGSGIYRDVELITVDKLHVPVWGTYITTSEVTAKSATVDVETEIVNRYSTARTFILETAVLDPNGVVAAAASRPLEIDGEGSLVVGQQLAIADPQLWDTKSPNLYTTITTLRSGDVEVDRNETRFGIRDIRYDADKGFFLNGRNVKIKGVNLHHAAGAVGVAVPNDVWRRRLQKLKDGGTNAIRTAHNPPSRSFLDLCDELGLLVQHEVFDEWDNPKDKRLNQWERHDDDISRGYADYFQEFAEFDLKNAMKRDRNHPSIVQWSIGNEIEWTYPRYKDATGYFDMNAAGNYFYNPPFISPEEIDRRFHESSEEEYVLAETATKLSRWVKEMDTTRPVTANLILPSVSHVSGYTDALDIIGYSYRRVIYDYGHRLYADKMIMGTENVVQWHEWKAVEERDFVAGTFLWTGIDYLGESHGAWPRKATGSGMLDTAGFDKPSYQMMKTLWDDTPHIYMSTQTLERSLYNIGADGKLVAKGKWDERTWSWQDVNRHWNYETGDIVIEVLSNCSAVELFLNGESLGEQSLADHPDHILKWVLPFREGRIEATGVDGCDATDGLTTATEPAGFTVSVDQESLSLDGYSVAHVEIQLIDKEGNPVRHQDADVKFEVPESLNVLGVDNGNSEQMDRYQAAEVQTSNGRALLIVRAAETAEAGEASILIESESLVSSSIRLQMGQ